MAGWLDKLQEGLKDAVEALDLAESAEEAGEILAAAAKAGISATALGDLAAVAERRWGNTADSQMIYSELSDTTLAEMAVVARSSLGIGVADSASGPVAGSLPQDVIDSILAEDAARNELPSQNAGVPFPSQLREAGEAAAAAAAARREARIAASSGQFRNRPGSADTSVAPIAPSLAPVVPQESLEDRRTRARAKLGQGGSDSPGTYAEILEAEIERLALSRTVLRDNLMFLDAINTASGVREVTDTEAKQPIHIVMAGLREFDPNVDLYDLVTGTTRVSGSANDKEITGTYGFQELMDLLDANDMLSLDAPSDWSGLRQNIDSDEFNEFNAAAQRFKIEAGLVPGGLNTKQTGREFSQINGWTKALESEEPERFMSALEEMEESGSGSTGYSEILVLEPPKVTKQLDRAVADYFVSETAAPVAPPSGAGSGRAGQADGFGAPVERAEYSGPRPEAGSGRAGQAAAPSGAIRGTPPPVSSSAANAGLDAALGADAADEQATLADLSFLNPTTSTPYTGAPRLTAAEKTAADRNEVHALLQEQFGGFAFFLQSNESQLNVGLTADGTIVAADDPTASTVKNVLDVIVEKGIVALDRVKGILQKTEWWQTTDTRARQFDAQFGELSEPGKVEYLEPILNMLSDEAQFLGGEEYAEAFDLDPERARRMAEQIAREGKETDVDYIRGMMVAESQFAASGSALSSFGESRDEIKKLGADYYVGVSDSDAAGWAEDIYVGDRDVAWMTQYFKNQATARFPSLDHAINTLQITPGEYFAPYKYEIEQMLDRDVDMMSEFAEVIEYIPNGAGGDVARPMTLGEARTFVRGTNEWQNSTQGQDQASALAFAIGNTFGEVA
jgi:hypothetical protein